MTAAAAAGEPSINKRPFGKTPDGTAVDLYTLTNSNGLQATITNYGGIVVTLMVPDRDGITEIYQLDDTDQQQLMRESSALAACLERGFRADKINIAALGNMVPQLHIHHVVRYRHDPAWPAPVWGRVAAKSYSNEALAAVVDQLRAFPLPGFEFI